jgi:predicted dehydrogenase
MSSTGQLHIAFLGCGFITRVHSRHLQSLRADIACSYASRDAKKAEAFRTRFGGVARFTGYEAAIADPGVDAVIVAVPPRFHRDLVLQALAAGKHVVVEKPAFVRAEDYRDVIDARDRAQRTVLVGENDHYKPLAVRLRQLLRDDVIGELVFAQFVSVARRLKSEQDWRNDETMAGGDAFFEEGIHWLHLAGSLGPRIVRIVGFRPTPSAEGSDRRIKSMMVSFQYDSGAVGTLYYSREIPSLLRGLRVSKLFGRMGVITFESNGVCVWARGRGWPQLVVPGVVDIRGYRAMYRDFVRSVRTGATPEMSLERALEDHELMDQVYASLERTVSASS